MIGIYLSGTGNTKHCVEKLVNLLDAAAECIPLEAPHVTETLEKQSTIILGYPTQFSNAPFMVRDFIRKNRCLWNGKSVFCLNTMGLFSGDGTGCAARLLKKYGAQILGGVQIKMRDERNYLYLFMGEVFLLSHSFLFVPMPLAVFPVLYFLCAAVWLHNLPAGILMTIFGAAHLTVSIQSFR